MPKPKPKPHPQSEKIVDLRRAGMPFGKIASQVRPAIGSAAECELIWQQAVEGTRAKYSTDLELDRLDRMMVGIWPQASKGDTDAVDRVLKIMTMRERLRPTPQDNVGAMTEAYDESIEASRELKAVDKALVAAGRTIAVRIDAALASGDGMEVTKALYLVPHMMNVLRELRATPSSRLLSGLEDGKGQQSGGTGTGTVAKLRGLAGGQAG